MKAVILAGGFGTRLGDITREIPKPMVRVGGKPILWHVMKTYATYGIKDFIVCLGYKGHVIKQYFANYYLNNSDVVFNLGTNEVKYLRNSGNDWRVSLIETGPDSQTGGRLGRLRNMLKNEEYFCFTYGDAVSDLDIGATLEFHKKRNAIATVTGVRPQGRFGALKISDTDRVVSFQEKLLGDGSYVNGGFFVLSNKVFNYINGDNCIWERGPLPQLAKENNLHVYKHDGFWQCMDTLRDKEELEKLWDEGDVPWISGIKKGS